MLTKGKMSFPSEEARFVKNAVVLFDVLEECNAAVSAQGKEALEPSAFFLGKTMLQSLDGHYLIRSFIKNVHPYWDAIARKDESFFLSNAGEVFRFMPAAQVNLLRDLFEEKSIQEITAQHKAQVWDLFRAMVRISLKYCLRFPAEDPMKEVALDHHLQVWKIKA